MSASVYGPYRMRGDRYRVIVVEEGGRRVERTFDSFDRAVEVVDALRRAHDPLVGEGRKDGER